MQTVPLGLVRHFALLTLIDNHSITAYTAPIRELQSYSRTIIKKARA